VYARQVALSMGAIRSVEPLQRQFLGRRMPALPRGVAAPAWTVWLVATDAAPTARAFIERHAVRRTVLRAGPNVSGLMRAAGNRDGGLPFTVALRQRRICREGVLTPLDLVHIEAACTAATATPR